MFVFSDIVGYVTILSYCWALVQKQFPHMQWFQWVAFVGLYCGVFFAVLVVTSNYLIEIDKISGGKFRRLRYAAWGVLLFLIFSLYDVKLIIDTPILLGLVVFFGTWLFLFGEGWLARIVARYTIHGSERQFLAPVDPPTRQTDILPFHLTMLGIAVVPWIVRVFH